MALNASVFPRSLPEFFPHGFQIIVEYCKKFQNVFFASPHFPIRNVNEAATIRRKIGLNFPFVLKKVIEFCNESKTRLSGHFSMRQARMEVVKIKYPTFFIA